MSNVPTETEFNALTYLLRKSSEAVDIERDELLRETEIIAKFLDQRRGIDGENGDVVFASVCALLSEFTTELKEAFYDAVQEET